MNRPELRIGDQEREGAVSALGEHYVAGRLTKEEFDQRSAAAWRARTGSELAPLFADLPSLHDTRRRPAVVPPPTVQAAHPRGLRRPRLPLLPLLLVFVGLVMLTGELGGVVLVFALLWWSGALRWLARASAGHHSRRPRRP